VLRKVDDLYEEYGRGPDGMLMPYVTHCYRAVVRPPALGETAATASGDPGGDDPDRGDPGALLIDLS
jgi:hypothetical protein